MARLGDTRSPSPGRHQRRKDDDRRSNSNRDGRGYRPRSRTPEDRRYRDRRDRDRDRDRDYDYRRRDRSVDYRGDDGYRGPRRDRRRSRDRYADRSPDRRRRDDRDHRGRVDDSRDRAHGRQEGTPDSRPRSRRDDSRHRTQPAAPDRARSPAGNALDDAKNKAAPAKSDAEKKAEARAKLEAWKKKREAQAAKEKDANPAQTRLLLAEMDEKAQKPSAAASPAVESPASASPAPDASPATSYAGKFDPKAVAKKSTASTTSKLGGVPLGSIDRKNGTLAPSASQVGKASALPANRGNIDGFGFQKQGGDKLAGKRKINLDEEVTSKRKLIKLPNLPVGADDTPYVDQDDDDDTGDIAATEEEAAAAVRAAHERRIQQENPTTETPADVEMNGEGETPQPNGTATNGAPPTPAPAPAAMEVAADAMEVDEEEDVDPLDAFMADLETEKKSGPTKAKTTAKPAPEPEAYFSDDDFSFREKGEIGPAQPMKRRKNKDLPTIDYSKIELEPIRKNFWVEPAELSALTEAEANDLRLELDGIKVTGKDVPRPVQKWAQCGLSRQTLDVVESLGFEKPTPIQMQALPTIMAGRDVVGVAKTGSGKTIAFLLPMFRHIKDQAPLADGDGPIGLIMTPTRELAVQIHRDCKPFLKTMNLRSVCAYGGAPISEQIAELKRGAEIVVCTPGRMIDLLAANQGRVTNLRRVTYVVLDEADRMFDMGFEPQVMKIFANIRPDKQTILFSATMPRIIDSLTKKVLKTPVEITVGGRSVVAPEITQIVEVRDEKSKFHRLLELLGELYDEDEDARTLIFMDRQEKADDLLKELLMKGYPCMSIHGGKDQVDRDSTISDFKKGVVPILIATSVAARGLDVKQLKLVVNYDAPNHLEDYVHRAGRTGRAGNKGTAVTFVTEEQDNCAACIAKALEQSGQPVPDRLKEMRAAYREKVKSGKAKESSGFGGKGLDRLDQEREAARMRERKTHKAEGEEDDVKEERKPASSEQATAESSVPSIRAVASAIQARGTPKVEAQVDTAKGGAKNTLDKVSSAVSAINSRLGKAGQLRTGQPIDNKGPDAGAFHATLEINDFPQKARWGVTNRTNVAKILDATGVSITTKGSFYPPGKTPGEGQDPKLYILVEGDSELVVAMALQELTRLLEEGTRIAEDAASRAPASGRYTVT
ncbi:related to Pre-mRNA-processing ATP-dependent RNA helicase PRP5 [Cephalotrichum gorgonifer]|uniref:RNA helicase n=1 Tax=Cephalotrichum gorgonifer TaxID=2041049 RepID=A0AAE8SR19_9PEZI|nr:related to Pre-mRNA-processing ATP-dependent RNA helicase PRP5 [Cephalotrichum gorgonifer]